MSLQGQCLCGASRFTATPKPDGDGSGPCHCSMCRKWSGGMFMATDCGTSVEWADGAPTSSYKGSDWGERIFCATCGSSMVWQAQDGTHQHVSIQCFENPEEFELNHELFIDIKPGNYALAGEGRLQLTQAQVMALITGAQEDS